jgi:hypothetical protein
VDREDILQAIEIALGDRISGESFRPTTVPDRDVSKWAGRLRTILAELPGDTTVQEIIEALEE